MADPSMPENERPMQLALLPEFDPIDGLVDLDERLPSGRRRWLVPKEVAALLGCDPDSVCRRIARGEPIGTKIKGRYFIDATRIGRA